MNLKEQLDALLDATAFDSTGAKIGAVRQVYVDDASGKLTFATVSTGIFSADAIVPLHGARLLDDELHVGHTRVVIRDSPRPDDTEDALTPEQEIKLLEYYGIEAPARSRGAAETATAPEVGAKNDTTGQTKAEKKDKPQREPFEARDAGDKSHEPRRTDKPGKPEAERPAPTKSDPAKPDAAKDSPAVDAAPKPAAPKPDAAKDAPAASTNPTDKSADAKDTTAPAGASPSGASPAEKKPSTSDAAPGDKSDQRDTAPE